MVIKGTCDIACFIPLPIDREEQYIAFFDALEELCQNSGKISLNSMTMEKLNLDST